jgi:C4-dicarboxylate-specific signal transduction histidine kinase
MQTIPQAHCMVDARALTRWNVDEARLPAGCEVRVAPSSWLERNWGSVLVLLVLSVQVALIALIVMFRRRSRHIEGELERQREAVVHTARLATVGELVASITHEINQPLGTIRTNVESAELLIDSQRAGWLDELRATLADIRRDDQRAAAVISHIRSFLRRNERENKPVDLNHVVRETAKLVSVDAQRRGVRIETDLGNVPLLVGDSVQLEQVLLNLVLNGMDAMRDTPVRERVLRLSTSHNGAGRVDVRVTDSGHGLPAGNETHVFDPFFTTKERGMGLGLSISRAIVEAHGGRIHAENRSGAGATVTVSLPEMPGDARQGLVVSR